MTLVMASDNPTSPMPHQLSDSPVRSSRVLRTCAISQCKKLFSYSLFDKKPYTAEYRRKTNSV